VLALSPRDEEAVAKAVGSRSEVRRD
jgi:hypothetical protein